MHVNKRRMNFLASTRFGSPQLFVQYFLYSAMRVSNPLLPCFPTSLPRATSGGVLCTSHSLLSHILHYFIERTDGSLRQQSLYWSIMESFPVFFKVRAVTFSCIILISFLWTVLLSVQVYARWNISDHCSRSLTAIFLLTNVTTILILPFLLLLKFRVWLDAARILFLAIGQIGSAVAFTYWNPHLQCSDQTADQQGVCKLINLYMLMGCWVVPVILILYASYFAAMIYRQSRIPVVVESGEKAFTGTGSPLVVDPEMAIPSPHLPVIDIRASMSALPSRTLSSDSLFFSRPEANIASPLTITTMPRRASRDPHLVVLQPGALDKRNSQSPQRHVSLVPSFADSVYNESNARKSGRLSKPLPPWCM